MTSKTSTPDSITFEQTRAIPSDFKHCQDNIKGDDHKSEKATIWEARNRFPETNLPTASLQTCRATG
jgi:hypothetical protein